MKSGAFVAVDGDSVHAHTEHRVNVRWCMGRGMRRVESTKMPGTPWLAKRGTRRQRSTGARTTQELPPNCASLGIHFVCLRAALVLHSLCRLHESEPWVQF